MNAYEQMREAMIQCELFLSMVERHAHTTLVPGDKCVACKGTEELRTLVNTALSAPPRNCDVGTAEEQTMRYGSFCNAHRTYEKCCEGCPADGRGDCESIWAQMPYEKEGGE